MYPAVRIVAVCFIFFQGISSEGQWMGKQMACNADSIVANPNRPTVADPADITQYGVLELEYGWDRVWPDETKNAHQTSTGGLLKFGLLCDLELRWTTTSYIWQTDPGGTNSGVGDNCLGPQIRIYKQRGGCPPSLLAMRLRLRPDPCQGRQGYRPRLRFPLKYAPCRL
jgi:hypothetical protein